VKGFKMMYTARSTDELANDRTYMAWGRSVMALERTLMAWIRTSLSLIGFGFAIFKFLQVMQQGGGTPLRVNAARNLGAIFIILGMALLVLAIIQFQKAMAKITKLSGRKPQFSLSLVGAIGVLAAGLITILNTLFGWGGF
jgi:putative membrane protein